MKKFLFFLLTFAMIVTLGVTAFAEPGNFVTSPSKNKAPEIIDGTNDSHECTAKLVITAYADRHTLNDEKKAKIEYAYEVIVNADDITTFNVDFSDYVEKIGLTGDKLAVSDLFDVSYYGCDDHEYHGGFKISLRADTLSGFVGLLHLNGDEWDYVDNATVKDDVLTFYVEDLSPFAIVVETDKHVPPQTGDNFHWWIYATLMAVSAVALGVVGYKLKTCEK